MRSRPERHHSQERLTDNSNGGDRGAFLDAYNDRGNYAASAYRRSDNPLSSDGRTFNIAPLDYGSFQQAGTYQQSQSMARGQQRPFYAHQNDAYSCAAFSMAMMHADWNQGGPPSQRQTEAWKKIAGTIGRGYRGPLESVAHNIQQGDPSMSTRVYNYGMGRVGQQALQDLNNELRQGHTAVAKVINPHTGNPHYIYVAGRDRNGNYLVGDPDRKNPHHQPISGQRLLSMMSRRDGFVAGWKDQQTQASSVPGTAAYNLARAGGGPHYA